MSFYKDHNGCLVDLTAYTGKAAKVLESTTKRTMLCGAVPQQVRKEETLSPLSLDAMRSMFESTECAIKHLLLKAKEAAAKGDTKEVKQYMQSIAIVADFTHTVWST